jgi:hypothetical protein
MKWLSDCINSLYSSEYTKEPISIAPLPALALPEVIPIQCQGCVKPCAHPLVPSHLKIDQSKPLENTVPSYAIHIIVMTGKTDWVSHIEDEGLAQAIIEGLQQRKDERTPENTYHPAYTDADSNNIHGNRVIVTNSSLPSKYSTHRGAQDIILLPDNIIIANITNRRINALLDYIYGKPCNQPFSIHPCPFTNLVLICGHGRKDRRCGTVGPMLQQALLQALPDQKESVQVALVSHLGGK